MRCEEEDGWLDDRSLDIHSRVFFGRRVEGWRVLKLEAVRRLPSGLCPDCRRQRDLRRVARGGLQPQPFVSHDWTTADDVQGCVQRRPRVSLDFIV